MSQKVSFWHKYMQSKLSEKSFGALVFVVLVPCMFFFLQGINARIGLGILNPNIRAEIFFLLVILCIQKLFRIMKIWDYLFVISIGVFCFWSPSLYPETTDAVKEFGPFFVYSCLPFYFLGRAIILNKDYDLIIHIGRIGVALNSLFFYLVLSKIMTHFADIDDDNMFLAYSCLPSLMIVICSELRKHNLTDLTLSFLGMILLLSLGTRGPVLSCILFVGVYSFFFKEVKYKKLFRATILLLLFVLFAFSVYLFDFLKSVTLMFGGSSRVIDYLQSGRFINYDNRDWIYQMVISELSKRERFGYGLFYDRTLFGMEQGSYCHNLFLELWLDFGYYIGSFLIIILMAMILINFIRNKDTQCRQLYLALFCALVVQLFFSSSYLQSSNFWFFIGVTVTSIANIKRRIHKNHIIPPKSCHEEIIHCNTRL